MVALTPRITLTDRRTNQTTRRGQPSEMSNRVMAKDDLLKTAAMMEQKPAA